ncbi:hypothetical protein [Roseovarius tibetensis]
MSSNPVGVCKLLQRAMIKGFAARVLYKPPEKLGEVLFDDDIDSF